MKKYMYGCFFMSSLVLFISCSNSPQKDIFQSELSTTFPESKNEVTVITLQRQPFNHELISNGKVSAKAMVDLNFGSTGTIAHIWVKNGDRVRKGQKLAELNKFRLQNQITQTKEAMERAGLDLQDVLIGQGYNLDELDKVPQEIMQLAKVKSGSDQTKAQYELAQYELQHATLVAPFDGTIANLFAKPHNTTNSSEPFCTIIDTRGMEVDFTVLESELSLIKNGDKVQVTPFSDTSTNYTGRIIEINPLVDDKGMVSVKAQIEGSGKLFTGMNVRISIYRSLDNQLVIPKSAVVLRSGKQVVFTLKNGKAYWNYVHTGLENAGYYTLVEGTKENLNEGDVVIVTGNINLAHETPVSVTSEMNTKN